MLEVASLRAFWEFAQLTKQAVFFQIQIHQVTVYLSELIVCQLLWRCGLCRRCDGVSRLRLLLLENAEEHTLWLSLCRSGNLPFDHRLVSLKISDLRYILLKGNRTLCGLVPQFSAIHG